MSSQADSQAASGSASGLSVGASWSSASFASEAQLVDDLFGDEFPDYIDDPFEPPLFVPEALASEHRQEGEQASRQPSLQRQQERTPPFNPQSRRSFGPRNILNSPDLFAEFTEFTPSPRRARSPSVVNLTDSPVVDLTSSPDMAPSKKRKRTSEATPKRKSSTPQQARKDVAAADAIDLVDVEDISQYEEMKKKEQAELLKQQQQDEANRPVKLAEFQCIICMDNPTDLTVTHCGHLFCSECLHEALHAGNNEKKSCPVCRTTISTNPLSRSGDKKPKNSFFHLEMKLVTRNRKGKQPQRSS
ncbi:hypothetical protein BP6252_00701 [Coleophoma cylindrospora]|uniref:RING-type domain-containing protein n=1 Tax=Coleophoma cylindrospora TaxID=1849047 RepID=A0A3D8SQT3_9HELO|nr:hypothetical protein BP6252_00701 [Coleophoma cylindrospora]